MSKAYVHVLRQGHRDWSRDEVEVDIANGVVFTEHYGCKRRSDICKYRAKAYREAIASGAMYLGYLDDDDVVVPGYFSDLERFLESNPDVAAVTKSQIVVFNDGNLGHDYTKLSGEVLHNHPQGFHGPYLYRADIIAQHLEFIGSKKSTEHVSLAFKVHYSGENVVYIDDLGSFWCQRRPIPDRLLVNS